MPNYIAIAAITLDGRIAATSRHPSDWTSIEDKKFLHQMLNGCDVILVGNNTYKTAKGPLSKRNCIVFTSAVPSSPGKERMPEGQERSNRYIYQKSKNLLYINPAKTDIKKFIEQKNYKKIAILGGAQIYSYCLENNLLDELYLTIEPLVFGKGISLFESKKFITYSFKLSSFKKLNPQGTLLLHYKK